MGTAAGQRLRGCTVFQCPSMAITTWRTALRSVRSAGEFHIHAAFPELDLILRAPKSRRVPTALPTFPPATDMDWQLHIAYLLGLNWEYVANCQGLRDDEDDLKLIEAAIKTGAMESVVGTVGEMETKRIQLEQQIAIDSRALTTFRLHPQYESIEQEADRLTRTIHDLANLNVLDRRLLARYEESIEEESTPSDVLWIASTRSRVSCCRCRRDARLTKHAPFTDKSSPIDAIFSRQKLIVFGNLLVAGRRRSETSRSSEPPLWKCSARTAHSTK